VGASPAVEKLQKKKKSILDLGISHVGESHKRQISAIAIPLNKCNNNYS
jgi:hypothetical protein